MLSWVARTEAMGSSATPCACARACSRSRTPRSTPPQSPLSASRSSLLDRKSTRLNSSHLGISYAAFCLKKEALRPRVDPDGADFCENLKGYARLASALAESVSAGARGGPLGAVDRHRERGQLRRRERID